MLQFTSSTVPLFLFSILTSIAGLQSPTYDLAGDFSINCGGAGISAGDRGGEWVGDGSAKSKSLLQIKGSSATSTVAQKLINSDQVLHRTARISLSEFSYTYQLNPGQKLIRLHFNSVLYKGFENFKDLFTVKGGNFILLGNFSVSLTADALGVNSLAKEFVINIEENQPFTVAFSPASSQPHEDAYAFINGIEITSVPSGFSYFNRGIKVVGLNSVVYIDNNTALEAVHRRNINRDSALLAEDDYSSDVFGMWARSPEKKGNGFNNIVWNISVDVGFRFLVRFHFSEMGLKMAEIGAMNYTVLINGIMADSNAEKAEGKDYNGNSWYRDYMVMMKGLKQHGKRDLSISLELSSEFLNENSLLKGFEIFKLSNPDNSLASPNPSPQARAQKNSILVPERNSIASAVIAVITLVNIIVYKLSKIWEAGFMKEEIKPSARAKRVCRRFSLSEIKEATENFSYGLIVGKGGFGNVYKGFLDKGREIVAIKRLKSTSRQGEHEFLTEIDTLSEVRHVNLVSLIGYCCEKNEMILVYEYMARGTLSDNLYKLEKDSNYCYPSWKQCLKICIGAARGLDYLHTGYGLIHRDVKASNILLDENLVAKISDFGLAKLEKWSGDEMQTHVSTNVKGTFGYLDPKYLTTRKLTRKSDTYAFGVVLLEVLCGRPALYPGPENHSLTMWALEKISKGEVNEIVASSLREQIAANSLKTFVEVAEVCLHDEPKERPTMARVVLQLEFALEQQENTKSEVPKDVTNVAEESLTAINSVKLTSTSEEQTEKETVSNEPPKGRQHWRKTVTMHKPSRLKPWNLILNRVVSAKKKQLVCVSITEVSEGGVKLPKFDFAGIEAATNQFAPSNKIGGGLIGTIYEAVFSTGLRVVVKRPWSYSNQGIKNEFLLLANLQHPNIVKLLGYCTSREEMLLVYELVENGDLASLLDDKVRFNQLEWPIRFKIITGIARGLVYLHDGFGIIHRCLVPNSILLDGEMNPKIATFGFARTLAQNEFDLEEPKITFGSFAYMSPECYKQGKFSVKSDVYSFGVIVLEILSGRIYPMFLVDTAIELWNEGKALDIIDRSMQGLFSEEEVLRCIRVAISCIHPEPHNRPTMASVVKFLEGTESSLGIQQEAAEDF